MAKLILRNPSGSPRQEVPLQGTPLSIGRDPTNDVVLADGTVSRRHAVIERHDEDGRYYVRDCHSLNGSTVNGDRVAERSLRSGDLVTVGATCLVYWEAPSCASCGRDVTAPARFCTACGAPLLPPPAEIAERPGAIDQLTAQQVSLIRAVVLNRADYLERSYHRDPASGQRIAYSLEEDEWSRFAAAWSVEPIACIRAVNRAIAELRAPDRIRRYLEAAVELETLMDRGTPGAPVARVFSGIPPYIMDGYTDMGRNPSPTRRQGREKIRIDKERLKSWLVATRWQALASESSLEDLLASFYDVVRRSVSFDEARVRELSQAGDDRSVNLSDFLDDGVGVCRHQAILYHLCLQEAAIPGRVVMGSLQVCGLTSRHAWNLAWRGGRVALVDVTLPTRQGPLIVVGSTQEEVYAIVNREDRRYVPTPDQQNHYKIGAPVRRGIAQDTGLPFA
jgi:hypothetical protein